MTPKTIYNVTVIAAAAVLLIGPALYHSRAVRDALTARPAALAGRVDTGAVAVPRGALAAARERIDAAALAVTTGDKAGALAALEAAGDIIGAMDCHTDAECERLHGADEEEQEVRT